MSAATGSAASHNLSANGAFASFHLGPPPGAGGHHNAATIGPGSGPTLRSQASRSALPQAWASGNNGSGNNNNNNSSISASMDPVSGGSGNLDDDIIPNAIVVKNIRFDVKREQLLAIMEELSLPIPYAFNYHFDQGVFRGLAFANFRTAEDADQVVAALNGFDVMGRKLRVEYKKVLQAGEKERIEKEKAIKRMQSMQMEKERRRMQEEYAMAAAAGMPLGVPPMPPSLAGPAGYGVPLPPMPPIPTFHTDAPTTGGPGAAPWDPSSPYGAHPAGGLAYPSDAASATSPTLSSASGAAGAGNPISLASTVRSTYTADAFRG
ncbi:Peptidyl-prolyl cis-trans isomerase pin4, partial [Tilletia horrida]